MISNRRLKADLVSLLLICGLFFAGPVLIRAQRIGQLESPRSSSTEDGRVRPPVVVTCDRNNLTSYTGRVITYSRRAGLMTMTIQTDWDTTETVTLRHPAKTDPSRWFLVRGKTFRKSDWSRIELSRGRLRPRMRVSAWVCTDGRKPILDWEPSTGNAGKTGVRLAILRF